MHGITFIRDCVLVDEMKKGITIIFKTILEVTSVVVVINVPCVSIQIRATYKVTLNFIHLFIK